MLLQRLEALQELEQSLGEICRAFHEGLILPGRCFAGVHGKCAGNAPWRSDVLGIAMSAWLRELNPSGSCVGTVQGHSVQLGVEQLSVVEGEN